MDMGKVTTFTSPQCPLPLQQHDRELASFRLALTQMSPILIAKNQGMSKMTAEISRERRNKRQRRAGYQEKISKKSNLRQNESPGGMVLERRWILPQAQKPQIE